MTPINYATIIDVDNYASLSGNIYWTDLTTQEKNFVLEQSTKDIESYHSQSRVGSVPWELGSLKNAGIQQALFVAIITHEKVTNQKNLALTSDSYNDSVLSVTPTNTKMLDSTAKSYIDQIMKEKNVNQNITSFGRA